jgi:DNA-binding GntR family transcriptional regulator
MIDALAKRDAAAMRKVLVAHVLRKRDTVLELLRAGEIYPSAKSS